MGWSFFKEDKKNIEPLTNKPMPLITAGQLQKICPTLKEPRLTNITDLLNELCTNYGITETLPFQMFLANVAQESGEFAHKEENMNYRAETLVKVWPSRFYLNNAVAGKKNAADYARNPQKLANEVYASRMGNGPASSGDGFQFKGAGFIGITGRELYTKYAGYIKKDVVESANLMKTDDRYALDSACWFFAILKNLIAVAKKGDNNFIAVVKGINGGTVGLADRQRYYAAVKKVLPAK